MKYILKTITLIALALSVNSITNAETTEFTASADATVESNGVNGQEIVHDDERIRTSMSGGSNIRDGLYEFDLSLLPAGATVTSASLVLRTSDLVTNTSGTSPVDFFAFTGNGILEISDQANSGVTVAQEVFSTGILQDTDLTIEFSNVSPLNTVLNDSDSDDYLTVRTETENFVNFITHSLESDDSSAAPAKLLVTFTGGVITGDVNLDCNVNLLDVQPFVEAISSGTYVEQADINGDGFVNLLDVQPFVDLLSGN
jgi:hypothetical protein